DQFFDRTRHRPDTFFGNGLVAHVSVAHPVCPELIPVFTSGARAAGATVHEGGCYLCMEGPQFSTRAESEVYRGWGMAVIGMTNLQEAKLSREAELCYATLALVTDYDCWHEEEAHVTVDVVVGRLNQNADAARQLIRGTIAILPREAGCQCGRVLDSSILTHPERIPAATRERLAAILDRPLGKEP